MADLSIIRENYARMPEKELLRFAKEEGKDLTDEALVLLKEEFTFRNLDKTVFDTIRETKLQQPSNEEKKELFPDLTGEANLAGGLTYQEMMYPKEKESINEHKEKFLAGLTEETALALVKKCDDLMLKNAAICVIGIIVTVITLVMAANGGTYVVAWGAILFGAINFFRCWDARSKYQSALNNLIENKQVVQGIQNEE